MTHDEHEDDTPARGPGDRRVRRTRGRLRAALGSLLHERPYEDIAVKQILARADVGRSTFYAHFDDKDDFHNGNKFQYKHAEHESQLDEWHLGRRDQRY